MKVPNVGRAMHKPKPADDGVRLRVNDETLPTSEVMDEDEVRTTTLTGIVPARYPHPLQDHGHHLQTANDDIAYAVWGWNEQARDLAQEDRNHDETLGGKRNGR
jgi:hypothetical protein